MNPKLKHKTQIWSHLSVWIRLEYGIRDSTFPALLEYFRFRVQGLVPVSYCLAALKARIWLHMLVSAIFVNLSTNHALAKSHNLSAMI